MRALVLLMVDALRHDYLTADTTPFLYRAAGGRRPACLVPPFGFEPDDAIFAGLSPGASDSGAQFWFDPTHSPFRFVPSWLGAVIDRLPSPMRLGCRALAMGAAKLRSRDARVRDHPTTARIPFRYLRNFDFVKKRYPFEQGYAGGRGIFDVARANGIPWTYHGFPRNDVRGERVLEAVRRLEGDRCAGMFFLHIGDLDAVGHRHGPDSPELREVLRGVDATVAAIAAWFEGQVGTCQFLVFGDHGMCAVTRHADVGEALQSVPGRPGIDYHYFLDSTLARFWAPDDLQAEIRRAVSTVPGLRLLDDDERGRLGMQYAHDRFGELIFQADEGCIVHPSFYAEHAAPRGMHGYGPEAIGDRAALVAFPADVLALGAGVRDETSPSAPVPMDTVFHLAKAALARLER